MAIAVEHANLGTNFNNSTTTSITVTTTTAVAAGGFIVIAAQWWDPTEAVSTVTFSGGGLSWTTDLYGRVDVTFDPALAIGSAQAPSGLASSTVLTMTFDASIGSQTCQIGCSSFTGVKTSSPVDGTPLGPTAGVVAAWSTGNYAIQAGSLIYANFSCGDVFTNTMSAGTEAWEQASTFTNGGGAYRIESSAGSYPISGTFTGDSTTLNGAVAYLVQAGAPAATLRQVRPMRSRGTAW